MYIQMPTNSTTGTIQESRSRRKVLSIWPVTTTPPSCSLRASSGSTRVVTNIGRPSTGSRKRPWMKRSETATSAIFPSAR